MPAARLSTVFAALAFAVCAGCAQQTGPRPYTGGKVEVVATTTLAADIVKRVGGDRVQLELLMPPGSDPHSYVPTTGNALALSSAHLVVHHGLHLEGKMTDLLEHSAGSRSVALSRGLDPSRLRTVDGGTTVDPHVWFDAGLWAECVAPVAEELAAIDPARAGEYRANAAAYRAELVALDAEVRAEVARIRPEARILVTSHDAFGYFGRAYGVEVRGLQGVNTAVETGSRDVGDLAAFIRSRGVPAIFTETSVPTRGLQKVLDECPGVKLVGGDGEALYSDSLGAPGTPGETYPGMIRFTVRTLAKYLR